MLNVHPTLSRQNGKRTAKVRHQVFLAAGLPLPEIDHELLAALGGDAYSEDSVQYWVARFESRDTSCEDLSRLGRPLTDLAEPFRLFLQDYPFASAGMLSYHFNVCATTVKEILDRDLGVKKFTRRWVPHTLSNPQKLNRSRHQLSCCRSSMTCRLILLMELQQATSSGFSISMNHQLCLRSRQAMSFQEPEKELA
jgi:hypothetical protein